MGYPQPLYAICSSVSPLFDNKFLFQPLSVLLLHAQVKKKSSTIYLINTYRYEEAVLRCPQSLLFSSTFPHRRCSGLRVFFWSCSYRFMSLLYWGHQNWMIEVRSPESKVDEGESPHSTCWPYCFLWKPRNDWLSRWQAHIATNSCSVLHPSTHPKPSLQGCSWSIISQPALLLAIAHSGAGPNFIVPVEILENHHSILISFGPRDIDKQLFGCRLSTHFLIPLNTHLFHSGIRILSENYCKKLSTPM